MQLRADIIMQDLSDELGVCQMLSEEKKKHFSVVFAARAPTAHRGVTVLKMSGSTSELLSSPTHFMFHSLSRLLSHIHQNQLKKCPSHDLILFSSVALCRYMGIGLSAQGVNMNRLPGE